MEVSTERLKASLQTNEVWQSTKLTIQFVDSLMQRLGETVSPEKLKEELETALIITISDLKLELARISSELILSLFAQEVRRTYGDKWANEFVDQFPMQIER